MLNALVDAGAEGFTLYPTEQGYQASAKRQGGWTVAYGASPEAALKACFQQFAFQAVKTKQEDDIFA